MRKKFPVFLILLLAFLITPSPTLAQKKKDFDAWVAGFRAEAAAKGISQATIQSALSRVQYLPKVIELQKNQPEFRYTVEEYLIRVASEARTLQGRQALAEHRSLRSKIFERYGVPPQYLGALWGIETDFGRLSGGFPLIDALSTLAYGGSRSDFFRTELLYALRIIDRSHISPDKMLGSWDGATIAIPGQALAYKLGQLKISELRARAEQTLGDRFDLRRFHAEVLVDGALPLDVLEAKVDRWIAAEQGG